MRLIRRFTNIISTVVVVIVTMIVVFAVLAMLFNFGVFNFLLNTERGDKASTNGVATVRVRPINLRCKTRIDASVPVEGEAKYTIHTFLGSLTVNTDTVRMTAVGDVDTCFPASGTTIKRSGDNLTVYIDASKAVFDRPRVKPIPTARSVSYDPGAGRRLAQFVPIINYFVIPENGSRLTMEAQAFAQSVIGGSSCMKAAWDATSVAIIDAYHTTAVRHGYKNGNVRVFFQGKPAFDQNDMKHIPKEFGDTNFKVDNKHVDCRLVGTS